VSLEILRKGNSYKFKSSLVLDGVAYPSLSTATLVKCALVEMATGLNVLEVDSTDQNITLDDLLVGDVSWVVTPAQTALLNTGLHSLAVQVEGTDVYEWVEEKIVNVKPGYIDV
jgi:hypothetical protein